MKSRNGVAGWTHEILERDAQLGEPVVEPRLGVPNIGGHPLRRIVFTSPEEVALGESRRIGDLLAFLKWRCNDADGSVREDGVSSADRGQVDHEH
jgi:hypothetical protein